MPKICLTFLKSEPIYAYKRSGIFEPTRPSMIGALERVKLKEVKERKKDLQQSLEDTG